MLEHAGDKLGQAIAQDQVDVLDVVGQATHQVAVGALVEESEGKDLQLFEQVVADISHRSLGGAGHDVALQPGQQRAERVDHQHNRADSQQARQVVGNDVTVDRFAKQERTEHGESGGDHDHCTGARKGEALTAEVGPDPGHRAPRVLRALLLAAQVDGSATERRQGRHRGGARRSVFCH